MDLESTQNNALTKLPLLKKGDYDTWRLKIESYIQLQDYALWEIIEDGNSFNPVARTTTNPDGTSTSTIPGENISQEDLNFKFLRSLPFEWSMHVVVWRNKPDLGLISFDDLYNNFKIVEQEVKRSVISSSNSSLQNVAFVSTPSSTNDVNTSNVHVSTASSSLSAASTTDNTARLSDATIYAFLANQPNRSQVVHKDLEQIHKDDLEEMDLKWQLALLSMKARKFYQRTGKKIIINGSDTAGYDKTKVECFNCHKMGHFARECRNPRSQENRSINQDSSRRTVNVEETSSKAMLAIDGVGFDWSFMSEEKTPTNFSIMAFSNSEVHNNKTCSKTCLKSFEDLKSQYDNLRIELNKSEFDLANYKRGLASVEETNPSSNQERNEEINALKIQIERLKKEKESNQIKIDNFENASKSLDKLIGCQISDNNRKGVGLEESKQPEFKGYKVKVNKSVSENSSNEIKKTSGAPIIEDWVFDCDEDKTMEKVSESANVQKPKQADQPRKVSQNPKNNSTNWNTPMSKKLGVGFQFTPKACFVCGSFNHLIKDCDFHDKKMVQKPVLNNVKKGTGQREVRPANFVNTAKGKRVTSAVGEQGIDAVKSKACWVWRPKLKVLDHDSKNSGSYICKQFDYVDPTGRIKVEGRILRHQELASPEQTVSGKDFSNLANGGYTPGSVEGSMKLKELTDLCTTLVTRVTSLETELKKTKEVHGKALTKLVKKVKRLEDKLKSTNKKRKAKMVISDEEEDLVLEDPSKQGRMEETEYAEEEYARVEHEYAEEEYAGVEHDFDLSEQQVTPLKAPHVGVQNQETFEAELSILSAAKILAEASKERVKRRSTDSSQVSTALGLFGTADDIQDTDREFARKIQEEEQTKALEQQEQERANFEAALKLQKQLDQEKKEADDIDWKKIVEQVQERQLGSMIRYPNLKKKPVTVAQARKNMMVYLKNMANYKMSYFKGMSYDQIRPIFEKEYNKVQTLFLLKIWKELYGLN
ncbi:ribonuclease H-like domain-containing protein [Tanacetum coccineum]